MIGKSGKFVTHSPSMGGYAVALPTFKFEDALVYMAMRAREDSIPSLLQEYHGLKRLDTQFDAPKV